MKNLYGKRKLKCKSAVALLLLIMAVIAFTGYGYQRWFDNEVLAKEATSKVEKLEKVNVVLAVQARQSKPVYLREDQIEKILSILMPKNIDRERFMAILKCENGSYDPKRVNINKLGLGYDLGIAQINSKFHSNRVKEFFGQDFDEAMQDPVKNLVYSVYLYQYQGFTPWVCSKIVLNEK